MGRYGSEGSPVSQHNPALLHPLQPRYSKFKAYRIQASEETMQLLHGTNYKHRNGRLEFYRGKPLEIGDSLRN